MKDIAKCKYCGSFKAELLRRYPVANKTEKLFHCFDCGSRFELGEDRLYSISDVIVELQQEIELLKRDRVEQGKQLECYYVVRYNKDNLNELHCCKHGKIGDCTKCQDYISNLVYHKNKWKPNCLPLSTAPEGE